MNARPLEYAAAGEADDFPHFAPTPPEEEAGKGAAAVGETAEESVVVPSVHVAFVHRVLHAGQGERAHADLHVLDERGGAWGEHTESRGKT